MDSNRKTSIGLLLIAVFLLMGFQLDAKQNAIPDLKVDFEGKFFELDNLGNLFIVGKDNSISKYNERGKLIAKVNYKIYGDLAHIDASNPFEVYLHYRDQQRLVVLDNMLSIRGEINLSEISNVEINAVCRSYDNGFWCFDGGSALLVKYSKDLRRERESPSAALWTNEEWQPHKIYEDGKNVYVLDSTLGIAIFDVFGQFKTHVRIKGLKEVQPFKGGLIYVRDNCLLNYDHVLFETDTIYCHDAMQNLKWDRNRILIAEKGKIVSRAY